ncbi:MAG: O-antigen ligase family protein [Bacteroidaceae bacterium]|nr:O-antigen ligase family protein [Bacteroidaceae bacterium]
MSTLPILGIALLLTVFFRNDGEGNSLWWCNHISSMSILVISIIVLIKLKRMRRNSDNISISIMFLIASLGTVATVCRNIGNASVYAMCVTLSTPALLFFLENKKTVLKTFIYTLFITTFILVAISGSRTGIIAMSISSIFILSAHLKTKYLFLIIGIIFILFASVLFFTKEDSSTGRKFILERTIEMIYERPFGWGKNGFEANYMNFQANYFKHKHNEKAEILADDIKHPLNEFLRIAVDYGIQTLLIFILFVVFIIRHLSLSKDIANRTALHFLIILLVWSCFSYPFSISFVQLMITAYAIPVILRIEYSPEYSIKTGMLTILFFTLCIEAKASMDDWKWNIAINEFKNGNRQIANDIFDNYNSYFIDRGNLLYSLATIEYNNKDYAQCLKVCNECKEYISSYELEIIIANSYMFLEDFNKAEEHYIKAGYMCPNRFIPLYQRFKIYKQLGETEKMQILGNNILKKKIKVPSRKIDIILNNVKYELNKL